MQGMGWTVMPRLFIDKQPEKNDLVVFSSKVLQVELFWKTWEQVSQVIADLETQVLRVASRHLLQ